MGRPAVGRAQALLAVVQTAQREAALEATMAAAAADWSERRLLLADPAGAGDAVLAEPACLQALQTLAAEQVRALAFDAHCACRCVQADTAACTTCQTAVRATRAERRPPAAQVSAAAALAASADAPALGDAPAAWQRRAAGAAALLAAWAACQAGWLALEAARAGAAAGPALRPGQAAALQGAAAAWRRIGAGVVCEGGPLVLELIAREGLEADLRACAGLLEAVTSSLGAGGGTAAAARAGGAAVDAPADAAG